MRGRRSSSDNVGHGGVQARGFDEKKLGQLASLIIEELRKGLDGERSSRAEAMFKAEVAAGRIQFRLRLDGRNWRMPFTVETTEPKGAGQLLSNDGGALGKSLYFAYLCFQVEQGRTGRCRLS